MLKHIFHEEKHVYVYMQIYNRVDNRHDGMAQYEIIPRAGPANT